jgi:hypothetical protein
MTDKVTKKEITESTATTRLRKSVLLQGERRKKLKGLPASTRARAIGYWQVSLLSIRRSE